MNKIVIAFSVSSFALAACFVDPARVTDTSSPAACPPPTAAATEVSADADAGADASSTDLCGFKKGMCTDDGCQHAGGHCKVYGGACVCQRAVDRCKLSASACGDNGCKDLGGTCEFVGSDPDCICIKKAPAPSTDTFTLDAGDVSLAYTNGAGTCADMSSSFEEPARITVSETSIAIVTPSRQLVGQIDPDGAFYARDANHDYVGKLASDGTGRAAVTYTGPEGCTFTYDVAIGPLG